jgi:hypothetical protein
MITDPLIASDDHRPLIARFALVSPERAVVGLGFSPDCEHREQSANCSPISARRLSEARKAQVCFPPLLFFPASLALPVGLGFSPDREHREQKCQLLPHQRAPTKRSAEGASVLSPASLFRPLLYRHRRAPKESNKMHNLQPKFQSSVRFRTLQPEHKVLRSEDVR